MYLSELDRAMERLGLFYARFMDDWVILAVAVETPPGESGADPAAGCGSIPTRRSLAASSGDLIF